MKNLQGRMGIILTIVFVGCAIPLAIIKFIYWNGFLLSAGILAVLIYVAWVVVELKVTTTKEMDKGSTALDKGTMEIYAISRFMVVITGLALPVVQSGINIRAVLGILLLILGITLRFYAIKVLGEFYSHRVRIIKEHQVIDAGPYRYIRHPSYLGMLVANLGYVIFFFNVVSFLCYFLFFVPAIVIRILLEEKALFEVRGYREYARKRNRVIPLLW